MINRFDAIFWTAAILIVAAFSVVTVGNDPVSSVLLLAAWVSGALGLWDPTRHMAAWLAGGVAAVSGAILTLVLEASMNGAKDDPSATPVLFAFLVAGAASAVLHNLGARQQAGRDRELCDRLAALPTSAELQELEQRLTAAYSRAEHSPATSWSSWWSSRPSRR